MHCKTPTKLLLFCLAFLTVARSEELPDPLPHVAKLDYTNISSFVEAHDDVVVSFISQWCRHCREWEPVYEEIAKNRPEENFPALAWVNASDTANFNLTLMWAGDEFPSVLYFKRAVYNGKLKGVKTKEAFYTWVTQLYGPALESAASQEEAEKIAQRYDATFIGVFRNEDDKAYKEFESLASKTRFWAKYLSIVDSNVEKDYVYIKHPNEERRKHHYETPQDLANFIKTERFPLFGPLTAANQELYVETGRIPVMLVGSEDHFAEYRAAFASVAQKRRDQFAFVWSLGDQRENYQIVSQLGLRDVPSLVVLRGRRPDLKKYVFPEGRKFNDPNVIEQFIDDVLSFKVKPNVRSGRAPDSRENENAPVKEVVGDNFEDVVLREDRDFLLAYIAPPSSHSQEGCNACPKFVEHLQLLGSFLQERKEKRLAVGTFFVVNNELPVFGWRGNWSVSNLPVVTFVKAGEKVPVVYKGHQSIVGLLKFWEKHSALRKRTDKKLSEVFLDLYDVDYDESGEDLSLYTIENTLDHERRGFDEDVFSRAAGLKDAKQGKRLTTTEGRTERDEL